MRSVLLAALAPLALAAPKPVVAAGFAVTSPDFQNGGTMPATQELDLHGCTGANRSPALAWSGAPAGTQSFAVTIHDTDARGGRGWWHWVVLDIPPGVRGLRAGAGTPGSPALPVGAVQGQTSFGFAHYGGPCPPVGDPPHHYRITVYALAVARLNLPADTPPDSVRMRLRAEALASARIVGRYGRAR